MEKDKEYYRKKIQEIHADLPDVKEKFSGFSEKDQEFAQELIILLMSCTDQIDEVLDKHVANDPHLAAFLLPKILDYLLARIFKGVNWDQTLLGKIMEQSFQVVTNLKKESKSE